MFFPEHSVYTIYYIYLQNASSADSSHAHISIKTTILVHIHTASTARLLLRLPHAIPHMSIISVRPAAAPGSNSFYSYLLSDLVTAFTLEKNDKVGMFGQRAPEDLSNFLYSVDRRCRMSFNYSGSVHTNKPDRGCSMDVCANLFVWNCIST